MAAPLLAKAENLFKKLLEKASKWLLYVVDMLIVMLRDTLCLTRDKTFLVNKRTCFKCYFQKNDQQNDATEPKQLILYSKQTV